MTKLKREKIQAITVCIFFSDFLKYCLNNRYHFDRWLIVTVESDIETIELCRKFSIEYCFTERVFENGASFAKGKAINDGISLLDRTGWIVHVDCDIILPRNMRELINRIPLNEKNLKSLFGLRGRRTLCAPPSHVSTPIFKNYKEFHIKFKKKIKKFKLSERAKVKFAERAFVELRRNCKVTVKAGPVSRQWKNFTQFKWDKLVYTFEGGEFEFLGYFQLFHSKFFQKYPEFSMNANHDDLRFRNSFSKDRRIILDSDCVHIGLANSGKTYAQLLDALLYKIKIKSDYAYLNKFKKTKKTFGSKLSFRKTEQRHISNNRIYLIDEFKASGLTCSPAAGWKIWNESISKYRIQVRQARKKISFSYDFHPNPKCEWFGFSIEPINLFDKSQYQCLYFELMVDSLNCELEVGYGNKDKMEWLRVDTSRLVNRHWYHFKLEFSKKIDINNLCSLFNLRSVGHSNSGKISVSEIFYTNSENSKK